LDAHQPSRIAFEEIETIAGIGWYFLDLDTGRWENSPGLDRILGIDSGFDRTIDAWASLIHPADRDEMVAYLTQQVIGDRQSFDRRYRIRRHGSGEERLVHGRGTLSLAPGGRPIGMLGTILDITETERTRQAHLESEERYAAIFEGAIEAIIIAEVPTRRFRWANPAACDLFGYDREAFERLSVPDIHPPADLPRILEAFEDLAHGRLRMAQAIPCRRRDGSTFLADIKASTTVLDGVLCNIGFFTDVTDFLRLQEKKRKLGQAIDQAGEAILITGMNGEIEYANAAFERLSGISHDALIGALPEEALGNRQGSGRPTGMRVTLESSQEWSGDLVHHRPDGTERIAVASISPVIGDDDNVIGFVGIERDVTDERRAHAERSRLAAAVEQTSDLVVITDLDGTIEYVNPAFERVSGFSRAQAIGQNPRILKSGRQSAGFYRVLWRRLAAGKTWSGRFSNRAADGGLYEVEATISPIRSVDGSITGYVGVERDVTALLAARSSLAAEFRARTQATAALSQIRARASAAETAADMCDALLGLPEVDIAAIFRFHGPSSGETLAVSGPDGAPIAPGRPLPAARAAYLYGRAMQGPWAEAWRTRPEDGEYGQQMARLGFRAVAYAPIRTEEGLVALLAAGTRNEAYADQTVEHLPVVGEFAAAAGALLGPHLERDSEKSARRTRIMRVLSEGAFRPVFQAIAVLESRVVVGYEALTRFEDGTPPDRMFAEARLAGLGPELEIACVKAALDASAALSSACWLTVNLSPEALLRPSDLRRVLARQHRRIVIEITEHSQISDYAAVRARVAALGPDVRLAVDDAGAGFASLQHIVELKPQYLKLDLSLVRSVDHDPIRQAMIAGLAHFAARADCEVIAEGIESHNELDVLRTLGVQYGQGYLLARPADVRAISCTATLRPTRATSRIPRAVLDAAIR
jgi:PAS domain S-box-containing protein